MVKKMPDYLKRIVTDPQVMVGKPVIRGTRIPIDTILRRLAEGQTTAEILKEYPQLKPTDVQAALAYASRIVRGQELVSLVEHHAVSRR